MTSADQQLTSDTDGQPGWRGFGGVAVGIMVLKVRYPFLAGNVANAASFGFPVLYDEVEGVTVDQLLRGDPALGAALVASARRLQARGVRAIFGACGSFGLFQRRIAEAVDLPVFLSPLLMVPILLAALGGERRLGVLMASAASLTDEIMDQCGIAGRDRLVVGDMRGAPEFETLIACTGSFDPVAMEQEVVERASRIAASPQVGALLLQCSDLPPFARSVQRATGLAVFDATSLIRWAEGAVVRRPFPESI